MRKNIWRIILGYLAAGFALIACPCHLVVTLPLILSLTAGTAAGTLLEKNFGLVIAVSIIAFIGALVLAIRWLGSGNSEGTAYSPSQSRALKNRLSHDKTLQQIKWRNNKRL
jgi:mercuric ion transport protein